MAEALARGSRITGTQRAELAARLGQRYATGESIRAIAEDTGRSFGFVHGLVKESGVDLRSRGGATRGPAARTAAAVSGRIEAEVKTGVRAKGAKAKAKAKAKTEGKNRGKDKGKDKKSGKKGKH